MHHDNKDKYDKIPHNYFPPSNGMETWGEG